MDVTLLQAHGKQLVKHMREVGYSDDYADCAERLIAKLVAAAREFEDWDDAASWVARTWKVRSTGNHMKILLGHVRRFCEGGELPRSGGPVRHDGPTVRDGLCPGFAAVLDAYENGPDAAGKAESTVRVEVSNASTLLARLEALGRTSLSEVTEDDLIEALTGPDGKPAFSAGYARHARSAILGAHGVEGRERVAALIPVPRPWRKVGDVLSEDERDKVREALSDPGSPLGQRDRAMGCLLFYTGMRACDISALGLDAIDWENDSISTVQRKTGAPLALPLVAHVGNALFDYVTGERGPSGDPHVFLSLSWPYGGIKPKTVYRVAGKVLDAAGVRGSEGGQRGSHLFRRTLATSMMGAGADRSVIMATLGHSSPAMAERYVVADVEGLRRRSLDVSAFPVAEGVLS